MVKVTVPASTANLGPGFDTLGIALNLYNTYIFEEKERGLIIEGCLDVYKNKDNLVYKAFMYTAKEIGYEIKGIKITMNTNIPLSRGLGSSSACIVGGVFGANALLKGNLSKDELFKIAVKIEGHPDNIAPAVYGGLTASMMDDGIPYCIKYNINEKLMFCALIPDFETPTVESRKLLPKEVDFRDAIFNLSRVAVLLKALEEANMQLINKSLKDKLHQRYRQKLINEFDEVEKICIDNGSIAFFVSGSGPTLMNIIINIDFANNIKNNIINLKDNWRIKILQSDKIGVTVI
ncbi:homoserine kinase [Sedimentibacter sp. MB31-C6]|uniref:homoserine kinase n=1 Tax=Sedimentibacter sp. MB31-C6 TaxID=3109366 RepID=UPI002DDD491D|nr:homoserine kinase [Sedimentibacter sp. MB36-C1]WSI03827.1 homoserine kinase [Sedimentibacter sp. MB36-C1]